MYLFIYLFQSEVVNIDKELQTSAANVLVKGEELVQARKVESNIASAIENLSLCLPVLTTYAKLQRQMKDKRYADCKRLRLEMNILLVGSETFILSFKACPQMPFVSFFF